MELGDLADSVRRFAEVLGWNGEIEELMKTQEMLVSSSSVHKGFQQSQLPAFETQ